ncbi:MAG: RDD family protein [Phycisphaerales bacterium]|nr:RDD family protein [Phycisphaerales bacterium]
MNYPTRCNLTPAPNIARCAAAPRHGRPASFWFFLSALLLPLLASSPARAQEPALQATANKANQWIIRSGNAGSDAEIHSWIYVKSSESKDWSALARFSGTPRDVVAIGSELGVVMPNGDWRIYWASDWRYGTSLPDRARILALTGDDEKIYAIARRDPAPAISPTTAPTTAPTTESSDGPATAPSTAPTDEPTATASTAAPSASSGTPSQPAGAPTAATATSQPSPSLSTTVYSQTGLFVLTDGRWSQIAPLPEDLDLDLSADVSLAIVDQHPVMALRQAGQIRVWILLDDQWQDLGNIPGGAVHHFALLNGQLPRLWTTGEKGIGQFHTFAKGAITTIDLHGSDKADNATTRYFTSLGPQPCLLFLDNQQLIVQPYTIQGQPDGDAQMLGAPYAPADPRWGQWTEGILIAAMVFVVITALRQRQLQPPDIKALRQLRIAPLPRRIMAGLVDLWPIWIVSVIVAQWVQDSPLEMNEVMIEGRTQLLLIGGSLLYILHTLVAELFTGRSLGKMIFGLRVVDFTGAMPKRSALVIRNVLRIIDIYVMFGLPLLVVLYTPLRQRMGDLAARTLVVEKNPAARPQRSAKSTDTDDESANDSNDRDDNDSSDSENDDSSSRNNQPAEPQLNHKSPPKP